MITKKELYKIVEYAIEFALQTKENLNISRAEYRHGIADMVLKFIEVNKQIP